MIFTATTLQAAPGTAIVAPALRCPRANAYQIPRAATLSPMSSPQRTASTAKAAKGQSRSPSRNQIAYRKRGIASVTGWIGSLALHASQGYARYASAMNVAVDSEPR